MVVGLDLLPATRRIFDELKLFFRAAAQVIPVDTGCMPLGSELRQELGLSPFPLIDERLDTIDCLLAASYS